jgi:hypothetical protein
MNNDKKIYQNISAEAKLKESMKLYFAAKELKRAALITLYPLLSMGEIELKLREIFSRARN